MVKGSIQVRKQWDSSALLLLESKVCPSGAVSVGRGSTSCLETALWPCHLGRASEDAGLGWAVLPSLADWPLQ